MGEMIQVLPRGRMTVCVAFSAVRENEVIVESFPAGEPVFRASSRDGDGRPRTWEAVNDSDAPRMYRIVARHKGDGADADADADAPPAADGTGLDAAGGDRAWVPSPAKLLFANPVTKVIGYEDGADEDYSDAVATVVWH